MLCLWGFGETRVSANTGSWGYICTYTELHAHTHVLMSFITKCHQTSHCWNIVSNIWHEALEADPCGKGTKGLQMGSYLGWRHHCHQELVPQENCSSNPWGNLGQEWFGWLLTWPAGAGPGGFSVSMHKHPGQLCDLKGHKVFTQHFWSMSIFCLLFTPLYWVYLLSATSGRLWSVVLYIYPDGVLWAESYRLARLYSIHQSFPTG